MIALVMQCALVCSALVSASLLGRRAPGRAGRVYATAFLLAAASGIAFAVAQLAAALGILKAALGCTPLEALALLATVYWLAFFLSRGGLFDKMVS